MEGGWGGGRGAGGWGEGRRGEWMGGEHWSGWGRGGWRGCGGEGGRQGGGAGADGPERRGGTRGPRSSGRCVRERPASQSDPEEGEPLQSIPRRGGGAGGRPPGEAAPAPTSLARSQPGRKDAQRRGWRGWPGPVRSRSACSVLTRWASRLGWG